MSRIEALRNIVLPFYNNGDPSHDTSHVERVLRNAEKIAAHESGVNVEMLLAATLLHDIVNLPKNHPERLQASDMAAQKSTKLLDEAGFSEDEILKISNIILEHSYSLGRKPTSIESMILQDADKLDALGAIGIMRTVTCGVKMRCNYYDTTDPFAKNRELDDQRFTLDHFYRKLLKLQEMMNTSYAKEEAERRTLFMTNFLGQLQSEI